MTVHSIDASHSSSKASQASNRNWRAARRPHRLPCITRLHAALRADLDRGNGSPIRGRASEGALIARGASNAIECTVTVMPKRLAFATELQRRADIDPREPTGPLAEFVKFCTRTGRQLSLRPA
jgi:hypothetical protein